MDPTKIKNLGNLSEIITFACPEEMKEQGRTVAIDVICPVCNKGRSIWVRPEDIPDIKQRNFSDYLTADEREGLITGTCQKCWDELFKEE